MTMNTVGLSLKEAAAQAETELAVTAESEETVSSSDSPEAPNVIEQPTVETPSETPLFTSLIGETDEQPEGDSVVEIDGVAYTRDQVKSGMLRQEDYTRKTQELAELRREAESALTLMKLLEERPVETVRKLYQQISTHAPISDVVMANTPNEIDTKTQPALPDIESLVEARVAEMLANDPRLVQVQQDKALAEVEKIFTDIEKMYDVKLSDPDKQLVLQTAVDMNTDDLKFVFGGLMNQEMQRQKALGNAKRVTPTVPEYVPPRDQAPAVPKKFADFRSAVNAQLAAEQGL